MITLTFIAASLALLATPGPTNTLLATAGASMGFARSWSLLAAVVVGYMVSILTLRTLAGPVIAEHPALGTSLRIAVALYLVILAAKLWHRGRTSCIESSAPVTAWNVLLTTLLNPKGLIFAFTIFPEALDDSGLALHLAALSAIIIATESAWIAAGAALKTGTRGRISAKVGYRTSAVALLVLAGSLTAHALQ